MPEYAMEPEKYEGSIFPPIWPLQVRDRNGVLISLDIVYFCTESGAVISIVYESDITSPNFGNPKLTESTWSTVIRVTHHAAPLTFEPYDDSAPTLTVFGEKK